MLRACCAHADVRASRCSGADARRAGTDRPRGAACRHHEHHAPHVRPAAVAAAALAPTRLAAPPGGRSRKLADSHADIGGGTGDSGIDSGGIRAA